MERHARNDVALNLRVPRAMADELGLVAMRHGQSISAEVREAIEMHLTRWSRGDHDWPTDHPAYGEEK